MGKCEGRGSITVLVKGNPMETVAQILFAIVVIGGAVLAMRLGGDPNRDSPLDEIDRKMAETKMYQLRERKGQ